MSRNDAPRPRNSASWSAAAGLVAAAALAPTATARDIAPLPELVVLADRGDHTGSGASIAEWNRDALATEAPRTLDELLARDPAFSLYRRQSASFGNPTAAGVSLRNVGASAASRTLVLRDGIPQNDPFGGWVYWARYDARTLDSVRIVPAARSTVWGNMSPAGVIQMSSLAPFGESRNVAIAGGSQGSIGGSFHQQLTDPEKQTSLTLAAFGYHSDGFFGIDRSQRGLIDRKLDIDLAGVDLRGAWRPAPGLVIEPMLSLYQEQRGNGTPLADNSTDALDFALRVTSDADAGRSWQALAWHQRRTFEAAFSSVNADRSDESLALDQYDVPGTGTGGAVTWMWDPHAAWSLTAGADFRILSGETRERVGTFRNRVAGGDQAFQGLFASAAWQAGPDTRLDIGARLDAWQIRDGIRRETSLATGAPLRDDRPPDRDGIEPSASLDLRRTLTADLDARLAAGTSFRLPSLNELHRPFRVRNDIVEANPGLDPERFDSLEAGLDWRPADNLRLELALFHHWIRDAISNVPVTNSAEIDSIIGTLPPGGTLAQRRNVDRAVVRGIEARAAWSPRDDIDLSLAAARSHTEFSRSGTQPLLENNPFPQAPEWRIVAEADWRPAENLSLFAGCEYGSSRYDDALATRRIPGATTLRVGMRVRHGPALWHIRVENLLDETVQTGLSGEGIRTLAAPRAVWTGVEWSF